MMNYFPIWFSISTCAATIGGDGKGEAIVGGGGNGEATFGGDGKGEARSVRQFLDCGRAVQADPSLVPG